MGETPNAALESQLITRDDMLRLLKANLQKAQDRMKVQADLKRREISFEVGDYVFLKLQPYRQRSLAKRRYEKLSPRFFGPYKIKRKVGSVAYELDLPSDARIHPVFHVSLLKPVRGQIPAGDVPTLPISEDWEYDLQPHKVLSFRWVTEAGVRVLELLIEWKNRPVEEATWEPYDLLAKQFPQFRLEFKSHFGEGCIDTNPVRVYTRKKKKKDADVTLEQLELVWDQVLAGSSFAFSMLCFVCSLGENQVFCIVEVVSGVLPMFKMTSYDGRYRNKMPTTKRGDALII
ncbi:hypothetical protein E3N88_12613 [Mikania micrantha]|uniref:Chromo domain-containing protein n=1 Tax=Mikania micrantha TaxID=192012 RepID=A0A5N6P828_9ASTR|nr:hypothetical protein E3N88_12613 [Mikania micrantha]